MPLDTVITGSVSATQTLCNKLFQSNTEQSQPQTDTSNVVVDNQNDNADSVKSMPLLVDSGCTSHICNDESQFTEFDPSLSQNIIL